MRFSKHLCSMLLSITLLCSSLLGSGTAFTAHAAETAGQIFYVSPTGNDSNSGIIDAPFATVEKARDAIRDLKNTSGLPQGGVTVYLRRGTYKYTLDGIHFEQKDSGTADSPITYTSYPNEEARFDGALDLDCSKFTTITDPAVLSRLSQATNPSQIKVYDIGINDGLTEFAPIAQAGYGWPLVSTPANLTLNGNAQSLARYPKTTSISTNYTVQDSGFVPRWHYDRGDGFCYACSVENGNEGTKCKITETYDRSVFKLQKGGTWTVSDTNIKNKFNLWKQESDIWAAGKWN
jgi:hypothetical protein